MSHASCRCSIPRQNQPISYQTGVIMSICYAGRVDEEIVDIVNEDGTVLRQAAKTEAHKHGWLHKTVIGYLKYGDDWALVCQAADRQDAGQLVAPVGGHVQAGESD